MALAKIYIFPMNSISIFLITLIVSFFHNGVNSEEPSEPFIVPEKDISKPDVCYHPYACFFKSDFFDPFFRKLAGLPNPPEDIDVEFLLFTSINPGSAFKFHFSDEIRKWRESHFNPKLPTIFIVHGWVTEFKTTYWSGETKNSFLRQYDVNVVGVNWKKGAAHGNYVQAVANSRLASLMVAKFIRELCKEYDYSPKNIWIIGHSIGAHIAGFVGKNFTSNEDRIGRITGLDPAGPFFRYADPTKRLDKNDAIYLETISTDVASNGLAGCGTDMSLGQIEILLNGGTKQPGCSIKQQRDHGKGWIEAAACACNHGRVTEIIPERFEEFADKCQLVAYKCDNYKDFQAGKCFDCGLDNSKCVLIGLGLEPNRNAEHGKYYVDTSASSPFCVNHYAVSIDIKSNQKTIGGKIRVKLVYDDSSDGPEAVVSGGFIKSGEELSTLITTELDPRPISYAEVYWDLNAMGYMTNAVRRKKVESMMINKITVRAMSSMDPARRAELSVVLCPGQEEIKSEEAIAFFPCE